jgi:putative SOS response-associated peptidase YedK
MLTAADDGLEAATARFGFSRRFSSFNARKEKLTTGRLWSSMFGKRHAIVPLSYVVEWIQDKQGKHPFLIQRADGGLMMTPALVGGSHETKGERAFAICTREPNRFFARFHDRMVGQCTPELMKRWLAPGDTTADELLACVAAPDDGELVAVAAAPNISKRKAGDWSPLVTFGEPLGWDDVKDW